MRYSETHKQLTKRRIVNVASRVFRERGVAETGVDEVMRRAGLTHGGFYAHFRDKSELVVQACAAGFAEAAINLDRIARQRTSGRRARMLIDSYLSAHHRENRGSGCIVVAVGADIARLGTAARSDYSARLTEHLDRLEGVLRLDSDPGINRRRVLELMSALLGSLLLARAVTDPARSDAILLSMREQLRREFTDNRPRSPGGRAAANDFLNASYL